jgi:hypothetical protein
LFWGALAVPFGLIAAAFGLAVLAYATDSEIFAALWPAALLIGQAALYILFFCFLLGGFILAIAFHHTELPAVDAWIGRDK